MYEVESRYDKEITNHAYIDSLFNDDVYCQRTLQNAKNIVAVPGVGLPCECVGRVKFRSPCFNGFWCNQLSSVVVGNHSGLDIIPNY